MARVIRKRVERGQQKRHWQDNDEEFGKTDPVEFRDVGREKLAPLVAVEFREEIERKPKQHEPAEAIPQRDQQFAQQEPVQQPHARRLLAGLRRAIVESGGIHFASVFGPRFHQAGYRGDVRSAAPPSSLAEAVSKDKLTAMKSLLAAAFICAATISSAEALTLDGESKSHSTYVKVERKGRVVFESVQLFEDSARAAVVRQIQPTRPGFGFKPQRPVTAPGRVRTFIDPDSKAERVTVGFYEGKRRLFAVRFAHDGSISKIEKASESGEKAGE